MRSPISYWTSSIRNRLARSVTGWALACGACVALTGLPQAHAQFAGAFRQPAVGGISIDPQGILQTADPAILDEVRTKLRAELQAIPEQAAQPGQRKISLRQLETALQESLATGQIPDAIRYLAGLQRIEYVLAYPEHNDIVLAGPGEPWTINDQGIAVGQQSGQPVVLLDDLLIALRSVHQARLGGITCSIDPRPEGIAAMKQYISQQGQFHEGVAAQVEQLMGPQQITVQGVPENSHFARVLVSADYRMKRIAMHLDPSPVAELVSYLELLQQTRIRAGSATPRWWLACQYDALGRGSEGLAWQLRGQGVQAMTETEIVDAVGNRERTGKASPLAQKWADTMTAHYSELATQDAVFGQLRNVMDLCVVAALMEKEGLYERTQCELPLLRATDSALPHEPWHAAHAVSTSCSIVKRGKEFIISASGGIQIGSWQVLEKVEDAPQLDATRAAVTRPATSTWWWN